MPWKNPSLILWSQRRWLNLLNQSNSRGTFPYPSPSPSPPLSFPLGFALQLFANVLNVLVCGMDIRGPYPTPEPCFDCSSGKIRKGLTGELGDILLPYLPFCSTIVLEADYSFRQSPFERFGSIPCSRPWFGLKIHPQISSKKYWGSPCGISQTTCWRVLCPEMNESPFLEHWSGPERKHPFW